MILHLLLSVPSAAPEAARQVTPHSAAIFQPLHTAVTDTLPVPPPVRNQLAPGTASIKAKVVAVDTTSNKNTVELKILETLGYGSATPPLATGRILQVDFGGYLKTDPQQQKHFSKGQTVSFIIRHQPQIAGQPASFTWKVVDIINN